MTSIPGGRDNAISSSRQSGKTAGVNSTAMIWQTILESESEDISFDDLIEYIRCNCCAGRILANVHHRNSIEDVDLLIPLAERWLDEILLRRRMDDIERHAAERPTPTTPARTSQADQWTPS